MDAFSMLDVKGVGFLQPAELLLAMNSLGLSVFTMDDAQLIFARFNSKGDGALKYSDFSDSFMPVNTHYARMLGSKRIYNPPIASDSGLDGDISNLPRGSSLLTTQQHINLQRQEEESKLAELRSPSCEGRYSPLRNFANTREMSRNDFPSLRNDFSLSGTIPKSRCSLQGPFSRETQFLYMETWDLIAITERSIESIRKRLHKKSDFSLQQCFD